jgi:hypothetical protein
MASGNYERDLFSGGEMAGRERSVVADRQVLRRWVPMLQLQMGGRIEELVVHWK